MRIFVLSTCTHHSIAATLRATGAFTEVDSAELPFVDRAELPALRDHIAGFDRVVTRNFEGQNNRWGVTATAALREILGDRMVTFSSPYFTGLHPETIYLRGPSGTVMSPIGPYHSAIVFRGHRLGHDIARMERVWTGEEPADWLDLAGNWSTSIAELRKRESGLTIQHADIMDRVCRRTIGMLAMNHPARSVLNPFVQRIFQALRPGDKRRFDFSALPHNLLSAPIYPVCPAVIRQERLPYHAPGAFFRGQGSPGQPRMLDFRAFAEESCRIYDRLAAEGQVIVPQSPEPLAGRLRKEFGLELTPGGAKPPEAATDTAPKAAQKVVQKTAQKTAQKVVQKVVQKTAQKTAQKVVQKVVQKTVPGTAPETTPGTIPKTAPKTAARSAPGPAAAPAAGLIRRVLKGLR